MSSGTTAVYIAQAPDQDHAPSLTLRAPDRSPRSGYAARDDRVPNTTSLGTTAVFVNQRPRQDDAPSSPLGTTDRSPRQSYAARTDQVSELAWVYDWLQYMIDRSKYQTPVVLLRNRFADRYSLRNKSDPRNLPEGYGLDDYHYRQALELARKSTIVDALDIIWPVLERTINTLTRDLGSPASYQSIAYRFCEVHDSDVDVAVTTSQSARYFNSRGDVRCGRRQTFQTSTHLDWESTKDHVRGWHVPGGSPVISLSTSPKRIQNLYLKHESTRSGYRVAAVDLRVLQRLGIAYGSTTNDLGFKHQVRDGAEKVQYATATHHLVHGWLPSRSIMGLLTLVQFDSLLKRAGIYAGYRGATDSAECDKQLSLHALRSSLLAGGATDWYKDQEEDLSASGLNTLVSSLRI